jgi:hypothetical protein
MDTLINHAHGRLQQEPSRSQVDGNEQVVRVEQTHLEVGLFALSIRHDTVTLSVRQRGAGEAER